MKAMNRSGRHSRTLLVVLFKEVRESLRDRRTLLSAFVTGPLLGPLLFALMIGAIVSQQLDKADLPLKVPVIGAQYAPNLINAFKAGGIVPQAAVADPGQAVRQQDADVVVRVSAAYPQAWRKGEPVQVEVFFDSSQGNTSTSVARVTQLVKSYAQQQGAMRLVARGLSPALATPVVVARRDQATAQSRAVLLLNMLPYLLVLTILVGGMYLAIDLTAGERERQSLEPLFANPVARWKVLLGKLLAITAFSAASLLLCLLVLAVFAALQSLVAAFAKSFREAQTYLSLLMMVPIIPSVMLMVMPVKPRDWMYAVPLLGQHLGILDVLRGNAIGTERLILCLLGSTVAATLAIGVTMQVYRSEKLAISA